MDVKGLRNTMIGTKYSKATDKVWEAAEHLNPTGEAALKDGIFHCQRVDDNLERLTVHKQVGGEYTEKELFLLCCAAALHDIWKGSPILKEEDHGIEAAKKLDAFSEKTGLDRITLKLIGMICKIHDRGSIRSIPTKKIPWQGENIFLPKLSLIFRIADMLDCTYRRINEVRLKAGIDLIDQKIDGRLGIYEWDLEGEEDIKIIISPKNIKQLENSMIAVKMMDTELSQMDLALRLMQFPYKISPELQNLNEDYKITRHFEGICTGKYPIILPEDTKVVVNTRAHIRLMFVNERKKKNKVLMQLNEEWNNQWLLPNIPIQYSSDRNPSVIKNTIAHRYKIRPEEFTVEMLTGELFVQKISKKNEQMTEYRYRVAKVDLTENPKFMKDKFQLRGRKYQWFKVAQCTRDKKIYSGNEEVIEILAEYFRETFKPKYKK
jgi:hypothetical protein